LKKEPGVDVQVLDGGHGEFAVSVNGKVVAQKTGDDLPAVESVVAAVRKA
jgi:hypothetical protein